MEKLRITDETTPINTDEAIDGSHLLKTDEDLDECYPPTLNSNGSNKKISLITDTGYLCARRYELFIECLRSILESGDKSHDIDLLRKSSEINSTDMFVEVELWLLAPGVHSRSISITLALYILNAKVIAYKSENTSFFFNDAPHRAIRLLFNGTRKHVLDVSATDYKNLPNRSYIPLSGESLRKAIVTMYDLENSLDNDGNFNESLIVISQMFTEAARFKSIAKYIELHLDDEYVPRGDTIGYENTWGVLSQQIQLSDSNGIFKTAVQLQQADDSFRSITNVAQVEFDIGILLYETIYPMITYDMTSDVGGGYGSFISTLRSHLISGATSHDIPLLRKPWEITNYTKFVLVELVYDDASISATKKVSITLAMNVVDAKVIGYKSEANSFFFINSTSEARDVLFNGTTKEVVDVICTYDMLDVDRSKIRLSMGALKKAIGVLYKCDGIKIDIAFRESLVVVMQMVSEATRFKFIQEYIESNLIGDGYTPKGDAISYENKWSTLSRRIQVSDQDGKFKEPVYVRNADDSDKTVSTVADVKPYVAILLYRGNREIGEMSDDDDDDDDDDNEEEDDDDDDDDDDEQVVDSE